MGCSCREGVKNPPPPPKSKVTPKAKAQLEKSKAPGKNVFSRATQPTLGTPVVNALDSLLPEAGVKPALATSRPHVLKPPPRGKLMEFKFSDDNIKEPATASGPSILEVIDGIRSPSPDFGSDDMDDLIRAAPDSALDADNFDTVAGLAVNYVEEVSSPSGYPRASRKRLHDSPPGPDRSAKRMRGVSDWGGDTSRRRFRPTRSDSVQEVGALPIDIVLGHFIWNFYVGYRLGLQTCFSSSVSRKQRWEGERCV